MPTLLEITRIKLTIQNKKVNKSNKMPPKFAITDMQNFARNRNSHLLSEKYTSAATKYRWQIHILNNYTERRYERLENIGLISYIMNFMSTFRHKTR